MAEYPFENEEQMWAAVEYMLDTDGWRLYITPSLEQSMKADMIALSSPKRGDISDDFLRGRISLATTLLNVLPMKIREFREGQTASKATVLDADGQPVSIGDPYSADTGDGQPVS